MNNTMDPNGAGALLQSTQQLRTHWSGVITTRIGYTIVALVAIWSYFLKMYIDSFTPPSEVQPLYILVATTLSAILLGLWHLDTHNRDKALASLYADFVLCEGILCVPPEHGTSGYLMRSVSRNLCLILKDSKLGPKERAKGISMLSEKKRVGGRGSLKINITTLIILSGMCVASIPLQTKPPSSLAIACYIGIVFGFVLIGVALWGSQKYPSKKDIEDILPQLKRNRGTGA